MTVTCLRYLAAVGVAEHRPWRVLRDRAEIEFVLCDLPPGVRAIYAHDDEDKAILVSRALSPAERLAALAHELVHMERGGGCHDPYLPEAMRPLTVREEERVERVVADWLLPPEQLQLFVDRRAELEPITVAVVAEEFEVAEHVAERAMRQLKDRRTA